LECESAPRILVADIIETVCSAEGPPAMRSKRIGPAERASPEGILSECESLDVARCWDETFGKDRERSNGK